MASTIYDSVIFRDMFGTSEMRGIFSDEALVSRYVEVEVALARAEASAGIIPQIAAEAIARGAAAFQVDFDRLRRETEIVGYPILPLVRQLSEAVGPEGRFVHWGATTQDIMDTASVLMMRDALALIERQLRRVYAILLDLAAKHRDTPMAGRTHLQHALPVTFGYKAAVWASMFDRHLKRIDELRARLLIVSFSGAAGTLASLGDEGLNVQERLARELDLAPPVITWHVARDSIAEAVCFLGLVTGSLAKIATDVMLMMSTELGEVAEPFVNSRGASSTMPQKRNPISCELIMASSKVVRQHAALMLDGMVQDFERATGPWHLEWICLPESFILSSGALASAEFMLGGLVVDAGRMRRNLDLTGGLIVAEAVMMALAPVMGRQDSHDRVYAACRQALESGRGLADVLLEVPEIVDALGGSDAVRRHCDPVSYLGLSGAMVDRVLNGADYTRSPRETAGETRV